MFDTHTPALGTDAPTPAASPRHTVTIPGDHVMRACRELYEPAQADLVRWAFYRAFRMTWPECGEFYNLATDLLSRVWRGKPQADDLPRALAAFRAVRDATGKNARPHYAMTSMARRIAHALDVARALSDDGAGGFVFIGADPGFGKTTVCQAFAAENNHGRTCYVPNDRIGGVKHFVQTLARANNVNTCNSYTDMIGRVALCFDANRILIPDDAHKLVEGGDRKLPKLEYLLGLLDTTGCVIVLPAALDRFGAAMSESRYNDKQLWRRCKYHTIVNGWEDDVAPDGELKRSAEQVRQDDVAILWRFRYPRLDPGDKLAETLDSIAVHPHGGFGKVAAVLDDAGRFARKQKLPFTSKLARTVADEQLRDLEKLSKTISTPLWRR